MVEIANATFETAIGTGGSRGERRNLFRRNSVLVFVGTGIER
jgi:hypothetical protein